MAIDTSYLKFYKIMQNSEFVGVGSSNNLRVYYPMLQQMIVAEPITATYIVLNDIYYRDSWMVPDHKPMVDYQQATVTEITEEEFRKLEVATTTEEVADIIEQYEPTEQEIADANTLEFVRNQKIKSLSTDCRDAITRGVDIKSGKSLSHYSFKLEDQIELMQIINDGADTALYHADNEPYREYSAAEIKRIYDEFLALKNKNRTYFNQLKQYIQTLNSIEQINSVYYGMTIPN